MEFGAVVYPAYIEATAGVRSLTDRYLELDLQRSGRIEPAAAAALGAARHPHRLRARRPTTPRPRTPTTRRRAALGLLQLSVRAAPARRDYSSPEEET